MKRILILTISMMLFIAPQINAATWYVDNTATGVNNGTSWSNAWVSLGNINWASIQPGDTIYVSGGATSKTYYERLYIQKSGTPGNQITVKVGQDAGHNGTIIIIPPAANDALSLSNQSYVTVSGQYGSTPEQRMRVQNTALGRYGIHIEGNSDSWIFEYIELVDIPDIAIRLDSSLVTPNGELRYLKIHNCSNDNNAVVRTNIYLLSSQQNDCSVGCTFDILRVHHNEFYNFIEDPIDVQIHQASFYNNIFHDRIKENPGTDPHADALQIWSSYVKVYNNVCYNMMRSDSAKANSFVRYNPGDMAKFYKPSNLMIYNNVVFEPTWYGNTSDYYRGIELAFSPPVSSVNNIIVANNTFVGIPYFAIYVGFHSGLNAANVSGVVIANNLFKDIGRNGGGVINTDTGNKGDGSIIWGNHGSAANVILDYNLLYASNSYYTTKSYWRNQEFTLQNFVINSGTMNRSVLANPYLNPNYTIQLNSAAKDAGVSLSSYFITDKNGTPRSLTGAWSIGAYEYRVSTISAPQGLMVRPPN